MNSTTMIVFKKEIIDIIRDKKTLIFGILIPLLMFPIIFAVLGKGISNSTKGVEENLKISIVDKGDSSLGNYIKNQQNINIQQSQNAEQSVKDGDIFVAIEIPKNFDADINKETASKITVWYDNSSQQSQTAMAILTSIIESYSKEVVAHRLIERNIDINILNPINIEAKTSSEESEGLVKMMLSLMLPMLLVIYNVTGPIPAATDLGAGEKERGTLEPLLTTKAGRMSLLWGKFLAITLMGVVTSIASIVGIYISLVLNKDLFSSIGVNSGIELKIGIVALCLIGIISILTTMVFGALELAISIYARSFKEASTYLTPLTVIALIPVYATYMLDAKNIESFYFHIPLANVVCILKELVMGVYNVNHMLITFAWTIVYILVSILFARSMFSREEVIFRV